jgi:hypothetical protein
MSPENWVLQITEGRGRPSASWRTFLAALGTAWTMGQIGSTPGILILRKGQDGSSRSRPLRKKADIFMPMKITRQSSAGLSGTAAASVWVRPVFGESYEAAEWFNRLIGRVQVSDSERARPFERLLLRLMQFDSGNIRWNLP